MKSLFSLTIDIDWAPDWAIKKIADFLVEKNVKCTWFITHDSHAIRNLFDYPELFEIGIHPNFLPNTTQGNSEEEIISNLLKIAPNAKSFRTHALVQSTNILKMLTEDFGLKNDLSSYTSNISETTPHKLYFSEKQKPLTRFPFCFEDDFHIFAPQREFSFDSEKYNFPGLKIFNFHPIFLALNIKDLENYKNLKSTGKFFTELTEQDIEPYVNKDSGIQNFFNGFVEFLSKQDSYTITELAKKFENGIL